MDLAEYQGRLIEDLRGRLLDLERRVKRLEPGQCRPVMRKRNWIPALPPNPEEWMGQYTGTFMARITDQGTNDHSFVEVYWVVGTGWATLTDGRTGTKNSATGARDLNGRTGVPTGTIVMMYEQLTDTFGTQYVFDITQGDESGGAALDLTGATGSFDVESQEGPPAKRGAQCLVVTSLQAAGANADIGTVDWYWQVYRRQVTVDANGNTVAVGAPAASDWPDWPMDRLVAAIAGDAFPDLLYVSNADGQRGKIYSDGVWISIGTALGPHADYDRLKLSHIGPGPATTYVSASGGGITVKINLDACHHVTSVEVS